MTWPVWRRLADACELAGVAGLFTSDHYLSETQPSGRAALDAWSVIAALAAVTERVRLGTLVSPVTFRHPAVLAKCVVTADNISGGRIELGVGAGWYAAEHEAYGFEFPSVRDRLQILDEQLTVIRLLTGRKTASHDGGRYRLVNCPALPKPYSGRLPIIVGGTGKRGTVGCAARHADEYNVYAVSLEGARRVREMLDDACREIGRDPATLSLSLSLTCAIGASEREVERRVRRIRALRPVQDDELRRGPDAGWLIGTPDAVVDQLRDVTDAQVSRVFLGLADHTDTDAIELLGAEVLSRVG